MMSNQPERQTGSVIVRSQRGLINALRTLVQPNHAEGITFYGPRIPIDRVGVNAIASKTITHPERRGYAWAGTLMTGGVNQPGVRQIGRFATTNESTVPVRVIRTEAAGRLILHRWSLPKLSWQDGRLVLFYPSAEASLAPKRIL